LTQPSSQRAVWRNGGGKCGMKMSCENPPLRQAAIPLGASGRERGGKRVADTERTRLTSPTTNNFLK